MNWLITGGCGFIGCQLIHNLVEDGNHKIHVLDNLSVGTFEDLASVCPIAKHDDEPTVDDWQNPVTLYVGDIQDKQIVARAMKGADVVVHLAANTGVAPSVEDPMGDCMNNVFGTLTMLMAARVEGVKRFILASSGAPLGVQQPPLHEEMAPKPASPYGASKLAGEGYCSAYFHSFGLETICLRFGNVYGVGSGHKNSAVAKFIKQALAGETIEIYGDGSQTRDFIYISDLIAAIRKSATANGVGGQVYQIATAKETSVSEMLNLLLNLLNSKDIVTPKVLYTSERVGDAKMNYSDTSKAKKDLDWQAEISLEAGLLTTIKYFLTKNKNKNKN